MLIGVNRDINNKLQLNMDNREYNKLVNASRERRKQQKQIVDNKKNKINHYASEQEQDAFYKSLMKEIDNIVID